MKKRIRTTYYIRESDGMQATARLEKAGQAEMIAKGYKKVNFLRWVQFKGRALTKKDTHPDYPILPTH
jgi:uncharacterized protein YhbP (UPF0306 family)